MADEQEAVQYSFEGDTSSLRQATQQAINLLDKFDSQMKSMASTDGFKASKTSAMGFQRVVNSLVKQVNSLTSTLNTSGNALEDAMPDGAAAVQQAAAGLSDVLDYLGSSTSIASDDLQLLTQVLQESKQELETVATRAKVLTSSVQPLEQLKAPEVLKQTSKAAESVRKSFDTAAFSGFRVQEAYEASGKSAAESAVVFLKASRSAQSIKSIQGILERLRTDMSLFGVYAAQAWQKFSKYIDPVTTKLQSFKDKTASSFGKVRSVLDQIVSVFKRTSKGSEDSDAAFKRLSTSTSNLVKSFKNLSNGARKSASSFNVLTSATKALKKAFTAITGIRIGEWLSTATLKSIEYAENLNLFSVATGEAYESSLEFVNQMAELYGMDPSNLMRYAGNFYQLADAIDMPAQASANLSLGLTKAVNDIASLFNVDIETVFSNLSSGMQGMSRAVRRYGMDIRTTTLQQTALSLGITEQVESMSEANRQGLRYITMMRQASNASGDFARTIEQPANQFRIFKEQISQLGRAIGDLFIKPLATAIQYINGFVVALRMIISYIGSILGLVSTAVAGVSSSAENVDDLASSVSGVGSAASDAAKEIKKFLAPFDELNVLPSSDTGTSGGGGGGSLGDLGTLDPAIQQAIADMEVKLENIRMKAVEVRDAILEFLGFKVEDGTILSWDASQFEENLIDKFPQWTKTIQAVFDNWSNIVEGFKSVFNSIGDVALTVKEKVLDFLSQFINDDSVSTWISNLADNLQKLSTWISDNADKIANLVIAFGLFKILSPLVQPLMNVVNLVKNLVSLLPAVAGVLGSITTPMLIIAGIIAVVAVALADLLIHNEEFRSKFVEAWENIEQVVSDIWNSMLKPILDELIATCKCIYEDTIKPLVEDLFTLLLDLWNDLLAPLISWIVTAIGPPIANVCKDIFAVVEWVFNSIGTFIRAVIQIIQGIIDFVVGVFTGDWERAWSGIVDIFAGLWNAIAGVAVAVINVVITVINLAISAIWNAVVGVINLVLEVVNRIGEALGFTMSLGITAEAPQIPYIPAPEVAMANGGVVTSPTNALIGEGRYDEAVVPLGNSPQMRQFADSVADRVNSGEQIKLLREQNELLKQILDKSGTYLDGKEISDVVTKYQNRRAKALGGV